MKVDWKPVIIFVVIALVFSFPVQSGYLDGFFHSIADGTPLSGATYLLTGFSTLLAAAIGFFLHTNLSKRISVSGDKPAKNLLVAALPILAFTIIGLPNQLGIDKTIFGFVIASVNTVYAFAEEIGWRRYLQNALEGLNNNLKYILISLVWWVWHFRFDSPFDLYIFPFICIAGGFLLGKLADDVKSVLPVVAMHSLVILTTNSGSFGGHELTAIGIVVFGWVIIEQLWKGPGATAKETIH